MTTGLILNDRWKVWLGTLLTKNNIGIMSLKTFTGTQINLHNRTRIFVVKMFLIGGRNGKIIELKN